MSELFARRADGESITRLCRFMEQRGVMTPYGNAAWCYTSLRGVLANRVYLGEVRCAPHVREGAHPPLTDPVTWQRAQARASCPERQASRPSLLAGLVRCAGCGMSMSASSRASAPTGAPCATTSARGTSAPASARRRPASPATLLEPYVEDIAFELLRNRRRPPAAKVAQAEAEGGRSPGGAGRLPRQPARCTAVLDEDAFANGLAVRSERVQRALLDLARARAQHATHALPAADELEARWPTMDLSARHEIIRQVIDCVIVAKGKRHVRRPRHRLPRRPRPDRPATPRRPPRAAAQPHSPPRRPGRGPQAEPAATVESQPARARAARLRRHPLTVAGAGELPRRRTVPPAPAGHAPRRREVVGRPARPAHARATTRGDGAGTTSASAERSPPTWPTRPAGRRAGSSRPTACAPCASPSPAAAASTAGSTSSTCHEHTATTGRPATGPKSAYAAELTALCAGRDRLPVATGAPTRRPGGNVLRAAERTTEPTGGRANSGFRATVAARDSPVASSNAVSRRK